MKKMLLGLLLLLSLWTHAQVILNLQLPQSGVVQKSQLWNIMVSNTNKTVVTGSFSFLMSTQSGQQILSAKTSILSFPPGTTMVNASMLSPIQYTVLSGDWVIDAGQNGFLPPGIFQVCYVLESFTHQGAIEVCNVINISPLSPPQLITPENQTAIDTTGVPQFIWIPPAPLNLFSNLQYELYLVQVDSFQTPAEAIQMNIPILFQQDITGTNLLYPLSAPHLQQDVTYAWQVTAKNNQSPVSASETWVFTLQKPVTKKTDSSDLPFVRLKKNEESAYAIVAGKLKFSYTNETADSVWNIKIYDISSPQPAEILFAMDSIPLKTGVNLVQINLMRNSRFIDHHLYLMELRNTRNEVWRLKFEFLSEGN